MDMASKLSSGMHVTSTSCKNLRRLARLAWQDKFASLFTLMFGNAARYALQHVAATDRCDSAIVDYSYRRTYNSDQSIVTTLYYRRSYYQFSCLSCTVCADCGGLLA
jgi:hypothetical protein